MSNESNQKDHSQIGVKIMAAPTQYAWTITVDGLQYSNCALKVNGDRAADAIDLRDTIASNLEGMLNRIGQAFLDGSMRPSRPEPASPSVFNVPDPEGPPPIGEVPDMFKE